MRTSLTSRNRGEPVQIALFDYGAGNVHSALGALTQLGAKVSLTADPAVIMEADGLVVPGVGAFQTVMERLQQAGGEQLLRGYLETGKPLLGICVGMQILFEYSTEKGCHAGLGLCQGSVAQLPATRLPHMGWSPVEVPPGSQLFHGIATESFYFVHSYAVLTESLPAGTQPGDVTAEHGAPFLAAIERGSLCATQFHPEKSGAAGLKLLDNWLSQIRN